MNESDQFRAIRRSIAHIESNLERDVPIGELSRRTAFSVRQLHRLFSRTVGSTLGEYIRSRRLTRAAAELAHTDKRILDIALDCRFQSQEAFSRAFKKMYRLTPGQYRKYAKSLIQGGTPAMMRTAPAGWTITGQSPDAYEVGIDRKEVHEGRASATLRSKTKEATGFVTLMQMFSAEKYASKRLRLSAFVKSENTTGWAGLWMRVDDRNGEMLKFDNMQGRPITGTAEWNAYQVVLDIPPSAHAIAFGILLSGGGQVWVDRFRFDEVDERTPTTDDPAFDALPPEPANLDFEL